MRIVLKGRRVRKERRERKKRMGRVVLLLSFSMPESADFGLCDVVPLRYCYETSH